MTRWLIALALLLLAARFTFIDSAPFMSDEPNIQLLVDSHLDSRTLPTVGLRGTRGLSYGPTPPWVYLPLRFLTDRVDIILLYHALLFSLGLILLWLGLKSSVGDRVAAWTFLLIAASPYLFFYSRQAWDNTLLIPGTGLALFLLCREEQAESRANWIGLGLTCGLLFNVHLMAIPCIAAAFVTLWRTARRKRLALGWFAAAFFVPISFYLPYLVRAIYSGELGHAVEHGYLDTITDVFWKLGWYFSANGIGYRFQEAYPAFLAQSGSLLAHGIKWDLGLLLRLAGSIATLVAAFRLFRGKKQPTAVELGALTVTFLLAFYAVARPYPLGSHYFIGVWWIAFFFAALAVEWVTPRLYPALAGVALILVAVNAGFIFFSLQFLEEHHGTRNMFYGTASGELRETVARLCADMETKGLSRVTLDLTAVPGINAVSLVYLSRHRAECRGKALLPAGAGTIAKFSYVPNRPDDAAVVYSLQGG